jgi:hypothetical protein
VTMVPTQPQPSPPPLVKLRDGLRRLQHTASESPIGVSFESPLTAREWLTLCPHRSAPQDGDESRQECGDCVSQKHQRLVCFEAAGIGRCRISLCSPDATSSPLLDCVEELAKAGHRHDCGLAVRFLAQVVPCG